MRIIAGKYRGRGINSPPGDKTRPTSSRTREAVFNMLLHHPEVRAGSVPSLVHARVADICCGTGAMGFEALSRGAASVTFVDISKPVLTAVQHTANTLKAQADVRMIKASATALPTAPHTHDILFCDPPYDAGIALPALLCAVQKGWLHDTALIVLETRADEALELPETFTLLDHRRYGAAGIHLISHMKSR